MQPILDHLREHYRLYLGIGIPLLVVLVVSRKYSVPVILFAAEFAIYSAAVHVMVGCVVRLAAWFKDQSTMKRAHDIVGENLNPGWQTPWLRFYDRSDYDPQWLFFFELVVVIGILVMMWRLKPIRPQKVVKRSPPPKLSGSGGGRSNLTNKSGGRK